MSRAVMADHVLFDECIEAFRRENTKVVSIPHKKSFSFLLTSFEITNEWDLGICKVAPSTRVDLDHVYSAFICRVENPNWVGTNHSHLFGIALAAIFSVITLKPCKSTRDDYLCRRQGLSEYDNKMLAIQHPILTAGPGAIHPSIPKDKQSRFCCEISSLINKLMYVDYKTYRDGMQGIRLLHLSILSKRDDFGLAYLLAVSSIESIAQIAIKREEVRKEHDDENMWKEKAKEDRDFNNLLKEYRAVRGKNEYLKDRFVLFLERFTPVEKWLDFVEHPMQDEADERKEFNPTLNYDHLVRKRRREKYPEDLQKEDIESILSSAYKHRSSFVHRGEQPPHRYPDQSSTRFFQEITVYDGQNFKETTLPNYDLLLGLSKNSLLNWLDSKC